MNSLERAPIIVTRPAHQARPFIDQLRALGAAVIQLPTIDIQFRRQAFTEDEKCFLCGSQLWIFTSVNAVIGANTLGTFTTNSRAKIACIGRSTAAALGQLGIVSDYVPDKNSNSEGLLTLLDGVVSDSVTIIRGGDGRDKLQRELSNRGNTVNTLDVYRRTLPTHDRAKLQNAVDSLPCNISITSNHGLSNLGKMIPDRYRDQLLQSTLIVNSYRCEEYARDIGFTGEIVVADPPGDHGQLKAFQQLY